MGKKQLGIIALLISVLAWGPAPVMTKLALTEFDAFSFAFTGRVIALVILGILFIPRGFLKIDKKDLPMMIFAGLTGAVFNVGFFIFGIQMTNAMDAQAIFSVGPVITAILAHFVLRERISKIQSAGVALGFLGTAVIAGRTFFETGKLSQGNILGDLLIFIASFSWVIYILVSRKLSKKYKPQTITLYSFIVSVICFAPLAFISNINNSAWISDVTFKGIFGVLYIGVFASVVAFLAYQFGIRLTSAFFAGLSLYLQPILTTAVAVIILGEVVTTPFIFGAFLVITGSIIATQHDFVRRRILFRSST